MNKFALAAALLVVPFVAHAGSDKPQGSGPNPYIECGIGAALFPQTHWAAVTSNAIWDLGTTAITSALSSPETCNGKKMKTATLILETLEAMEQDIADGGGATTIALADTIGCSASREALVAKVRDNYASIVAQPGYATQSREARANNLYGSVKSAASAVAPSCAVSL